MSLAFDHAILCARDLEAAARWLLDQHGLASVPGGRHAGHGTCNRIVPLGTDYLELMGVEDAEEAAASPMGRWVKGEIDRGAGLLALCLRSDDVAAIARRLGSEPAPLSRTRPDGQVVRCRLAGLAGAMGDERLPFFIQWDVPDELHPGRERVPHRSAPLGIAWAEVGGDPERLARWLGEPGPPLRPAGGSPGLRAIGIATAAGEIVLR